MQSYVWGAYISPDSTNYLRAAQSLRDGYGFHVNAAAGDTETYFAIWPIGYPAMIALVSLITNTEIYLASKILSVILLTIIFVMLYIRFKKYAWLYAFITVNFGFLNIFYYTWSEQPFILGLIWLSFAVIDIFKSEKIRYFHYINIGLASLLLFFSRYIGAFSVGLIGLMASYHLVTGMLRNKKQNIKKGILLFIVAAITTAVIIQYLFSNLKNSGYMTGMERVPISENPFVLFLMLCKAQIIEMQNVFFMFFNISYGMSFMIYILCGIAGFRFIHLKRSHFKTSISITTFSFFFIGLLYWFSIVAMRFSAAFDGFSYRLLFPASALFSLAVISAMEKHFSNIIEKATLGFRRYLWATIIVVSLLSSLAKPLYNSIFKHERLKGYHEIRADIINELSHVPPQSLIISEWSVEESYCNFIRPDLLMMVPRWPPKNIEQILSLIEQSEKVYIYADWQLLPDENRISIYSFLTQYIHDDIDTTKKLMQIK